MLLPKKFHNIIITFITPLRIQNELFNKKKLMIGLDWNTFSSYCFKYCIKVISLRMKQSYKLKMAFSLSQHSLCVNVVELVTSNGGKLL